MRIQKITPVEVVVSEISTRSSGRRKAAQSRKLDTSSCRYTLPHRPTGCSVSDEVPPGHYSRKEFSQAKEKLFDRLWHELESKVATKPGGRVHPE